MNLASVDLNLLVAFEALMIERNVTRAGQRVGLGQPAMSAALGRLRLTFKDELLVRVPGAPMRSTERADTLHRAITEVLAMTRAVFDDEVGFDPSEARSVYRIATSDFPATMILPQFLEILAAEAPHVDVRIVALDKRDAFDLVDRGEIDLLMGSFRDVPKRIRRKPLYTDEYVCMIRKGHPLLGTDGALSLDAYVTAPHVLVTLAADDRGVVDEVLAEEGLRRRVALTIMDFHLAPNIIARTNLIGHVPRRIAYSLARDDRLLVVPPPIPLPPWNSEMYWGGVSDAEPAAKWFRAQLIAIGREIEAGGNG